MALAGGLFGERKVSRAWRVQGWRPVVADGLVLDTTGVLKWRFVSGGRRPEDRAERFRGSGQLQRREYVFSVVS